MANCKPLYNVFPRQTTPQPAYLYVYGDGTVECDYQHNIGNAVSPNIWHGIDLRFRVSEYLGNQDISDLIEEIKPLVDELLSESVIAWNGSNHTREFSQRGEQIRHEIEQICTHFRCDGHEELCGYDDCEYCKEN